MTVTKYLELRSALQQPPQPPPLSSPPHSSKRFAHIARRPAPTHRHSACSPALSDDTPRPPQRPPHASPHLQHTCPQPRRRPPPRLQRQPQESARSVDSDSDSATACMSFLANHAAHGSSQHSLTSLCLCAQLSAATKPTQEGQGQQV